MKEKPEMYLSLINLNFFKLVPNFMSRETFPSQPDHHQSYEPRACDFSSYVPILAFKTRIVAFTRACSTSVMYICAFSYILKYTASIFMSDPRHQPGIPCEVTD
jgi:hypothetical protein